MPPLPIHILPLVLWPCWDLPNGPCTNEQPLLQVHDSLAGSVPSYRYKMCLCGNICLHEGNTLVQTAQQSIVVGVTMHPLCWREDALVWLVWWYCACWLLICLNEEDGAK
jgi:hypothetical protein